MFEEQVLGVIELGSLRPLGEVNQAFLDQLTDTIGVVINTIQANMRTEELLSQSQALTQELQKQSEELRQTNDELQDKAILLSQQNRDIEIKNAEIELARRGLEEKAAQLALSSKYKSEFLANMSHELRTPLNSLLILSRMLAENAEGNLGAQQVEFAETIYAAGNDLLALINDILDLSKVEAGKMDLHVSQLALGDLREDVERAFRPVAEEKGLRFAIETDPRLPAAIVTDEQRLQQILRNLLSNAVKFTHHGSVTLRIAAAGRRRTRSSSRSSTPGSASPTRSSWRSSRPSSRPTGRRRASTAAPGSGCRSAARSLACSAARSTSRAPRRGQHVHAAAAAGPTRDRRAPRGARAGGGRCRRRRRARRRRGGAPALDPEDDDRATIDAGDRVLLVIAHDAQRARAAIDAAHGRGLKALLARRAPMGLVLAREFRPDAVLLFAGDGRGEVLLGQLKQHPETRHRPVYVVGPPAGRLAALRAGAAAHLPTDDGGDAARQALEHLDGAEAPVQPDHAGSGGGGHDEQDRHGRADEDQDERGRPPPDPHEDVLRRWRPRCAPRPTATSPSACPPAARASSATSRPPTTSWSSATPSSPPSSCASAASSAARAA